MRLDSARELKASLAEDVLARLAAPAQAKTLGVAARPLETLAGEPPTMALGIAPRGKRDFVLAVRVQQRALERGQHLEVIRRRARKEINVRYIGRVAKRAAPWHQRRNR